MNNLEFLVELGKCCIDIKVSSALGDSYRKTQCIREARRLVFQEGLLRWSERKYHLPNFLGENSPYSSFKNLFEDAFRCPEETKKQFKDWMSARDALPFLKSWMPYSELKMLDPKIKYSLYKYEEYLVRRLEEEERIEYETSGHYRDILDLLAHSITNTNEVELGNCWVFMTDDYIIEMHNLIGRLERFEPENQYLLVQE